MLGAFAVSALGLGFQAEATPAPEVQGVRELWRAGVSEVEAQPAGAIAVASWAPSQTKEWRKRLAGLVGPSTVAVAIILPAGGLPPGVVGAWSASLGSAAST